jgi:modulator of FtsH protease
MSFQSPYAESRTARRETTAVFAQTMFLVAVALGFCVAGTLIGRDLSTGAARACSFAGLGMLLVQGFLGGRIRALRVGAFAIGWMCVLALLIGLGLAPFVAYVATVDPSALTTAIAGTALTVLGMAALGLALSKDLAGWMRPLSYAVFAAVVVSLLGLVFGGLGALNPLLSLLIFGLSALLIMVDFNYLRRHATEDDAVWLATGIFVSVVNIFISLLNLSR